MDSQLLLSEIAEMADGQLIGPDIKVDGFTTDTRQLESGDLFIALAGEKYDGHDFIHAQLSSQVKALFVHREVDSTLPKVVVKDTLKGLSCWATAWRHHVDPYVIAVTGSNGKTTVKQMLASVFAQAGKTYCTRGNLNNHIGVPLTLLQCKKDAEYAVIEMGANHIGEIDHLSRLTQPNIAIITNAGPAHLEGFGSLNGVAHGKGEIINGLMDAGHIILNADDKYCAFWLQKAEHVHAVTFGFSQQADIRGQLNGQQLSVYIDEQALLINLPLPGRHNACNALAVVAAASVAGLSAQQIRQGLEQMHQESSRLEFKRTSQGAQIIDDSYNANPASLKAAIEVLCAQSRQAWLVLGDMGELGAEELSIHEQMGKFAKSAGIKKLFALGELSRYAVQGFGEGAIHFETHQQLSDALTQQLEQDCSVLVKGSRSMQMEKIVEAVIHLQSLH